MRRFKPSFSTFALSIDTDIIRTVFAQLVRPSRVSHGNRLYQPINPNGVAGDVIGYSQR